MNLHRRLLVPVGIVAGGALAGTSAAQCGQVVPGTTRINNGTGALYREFRELAIGMTSNLGRNDRKNCPTCPSWPMAAGDVLFGSSRGLSLCAPTTCSITTSCDEDQTIDFWLPTIAPGPNAPNQYTLGLDVGALSHEMGLHGITQTNGNANLGSNVRLQTISGSSSGSAIKFYNTSTTVNASPTFQATISVSGVPNTTSPEYESRLVCRPAICDTHAGLVFDSISFSPMISLRMGAALSVLESRTPPNYEFIVHAGDMNPIPGYMHDEPDGELITRVFEEGSYCVAVSDRDLANNQTSDIADETFRDGLLLDRPGAILTTSDTAPIEDLSFRVGTPDRMAVISVRKDEPYDVKFVEFRVVAPGTSVPPTGQPLSTPSSADNCGAAEVLLTVIAYAGNNPTSTGLTVTADLSLIGGPSVASLVDDGTAGDVTAGDSVFSLLTLVTAGTPDGHLRLPFTVADSMARSSSEYIHLDVDACASGCPPCAGDFNQDGGVDGQDVETFMRAWAAADVRADTNLDGGVDGADVETFFLVWQAGGG